MLPGRKRTILASLMVGVLLFAQGIAVAENCLGLEAAPAMAFSEEKMAGQDCHEATPAATSNPNACLQHCTVGDQTTAQAPAAVPDMAGIAVLIVPMPVEGIRLAVRTEACDLLSPGPPPSLRFCSFQL